MFSQSIGKGVGFQWRGEVWGDGALFQGQKNYMAEPVQHTNLTLDFHLNGFAHFFDTPLPASLFDVKLILGVIIRSLRRIRIKGPLNRKTPLLDMPVYQEGRKSLS